MHGSHHSGGDHHRKPYTIASLLHKATPNTQAGGRRGPSPPRQSPDAMDVPVPRYTCMCDDNYEVCECRLREALGLPTMSGIVRGRSRTVSSSRPRQYAPPMKSDFVVHSAPRGLSAPIDRMKKPYTPAALPPRQPRTPSLERADRKKEDALLDADGERCSPAASPTGGTELVPAEPPSTSPPPETPLRRMSAVGMNRTEREANLPHDKEDNVPRDGFPVADNKWDRARRMSGSHGGEGERPLTFPPRNEASRSPSVKGIVPEGSPPPAPHHSAALSKKSLRTRRREQMLSEILKLQEKLSYLEGKKV